MKQETIDIMRAWLDGETVEESLSSGRWVEIGGPDKVRSAVFEDYRVYRIKPRTIRIGKYDVPEPEREAPMYGQKYYVPSITSEDRVSTRDWIKHSTDFSLLSSGLIHLTIEAAETHAKALLSLTGGKA